MDFDIKDYLYAIRRRLWLPVAVPLAAALITGGILYLQPEQYQATATVVVPALSAKGYSTSAVTQYFSTYKDVLVSAPVINQVNASTGESKNNLAAGLSANVVTASSNIIEVTYTGPRKGNVQLVAQTAAMDALDVLVAPQLSAATSELSTAQSTLSDANSKLTEFDNQTGYIFPEDEYKYQSQELSALIVQLQQANLAGDRSRIKGLSQVIDKRQKDLLKLAPIVIQWRNLDQAINAAQTEYNHAVIDLNLVNAQIASDHDPRTITVKNQGHISRVPTVLRFGGVAAGVALLLALGFIVFMEFFRPAVAQIPYLSRLAIPARSSPGAAAELSEPVPVAAHSNGGASSGSKPKTPA